MKPKTRFLNRDILGLQEESCEECGGTGKVFSLDAATDAMLKCTWCHGSGQVAELDLAFRQPVQNELTLK